MENHDKIAIREINQNKGEMYLLDYRNHPIIVSDFEFNFINYFFSIGNGDDQFWGPSVRNLFQKRICLCQLKN